MKKLKKVDVNTAFLHSLFLTSNNFERENFRKNNKIMIKRSCVVMSIRYGEIKDISRPSRVS
jgi:hypothetical protein